MGGISWDELEVTSGNRNAQTIEIQEVITPVTDYFYIRLYRCGVGTEPRI